MPVTFSPNNIPAEHVSHYNIDTASNTPLELLESACPNQYEKCEELLQSSFTKTDDIQAKPNGFVDTVVDAYNEHHHLIIRPDDVWTAILVQFSFFVNANSEALRSHFVAHEGKKGLVVTAGGNRYTMDFGRLAERMTQEIDKNVLDPTLREWILPKFTTTTDNDTIVFATVMMATFQKYFHYTFSLRCGLPSVTLEGEKYDWESILNRIEKLKEYGPHTTVWYHLLKPVISRFVKAFDDPEGSENLEFWRRVCHKEGSGSGPRYLGGWITAFCVFDSEGKWISHPLRGLEESTEFSLDADKGSKEFGIQQQTPLTPTHAFLDLKMTEFFKKNIKEPWRFCHHPLLVLDGSPYHLVDDDAIPQGYAEVDVLLDDNGVEFPSIMTAGLVGTKMECSTSEEENALLPDTVRPVSGWWMFIERPSAEEG